MTNSNSVRVPVGVHMMKPHDTTRPASFLLGFFFSFFFCLSLISSFLALFSNLVFIN